MSKETTIVNWGNSKAICIPEEIVRQLNLETNQIVSIAIENGSIILTPIETKANSIHELFKDWKDDGIRETEVDWGNSEGNEWDW